MNDVILVHEYIASVLPEVIGKPAADGRVVVVHLGSGASMCAMRRRRSVATTMGFTALDGLPMGQRCSDLMIARHTLAVLNLQPG
jgi:acetate kinase